MIILVVAVLLSDFLKHILKCNSTVDFKIDVIDAIDANRFKQKI